jgi:hypothetical protein
VDPDRRLAVVTAVEQRQTELERVGGAGLDDHATTGPESFRKQFFELAEVDLNLRGEGEVLGTRQSGLPRFRVATLPEDAPILGVARADLIAILERTGSLETSELGPLVDAVRERFGDERAEPIAA